MRKTMQQTSQTKTMWRASCWCCHLHGCPYGHLEWSGQCTTRPLCRHSRENSWQEFKYLLAWSYATNFKSVMQHVQLFNYKQMPAIGNSKIVWWINKIAEVTRMLNMCLYDLCRGAMIGNVCRKIGGPQRNSCTSPGLASSLHNHGSICEHTGGKVIDDEALQRATHGYLPCIHQQSHIIYSSQIVVSKCCFRVNADFQYLWTIYLTANLHPSLQLV